MLVLSRREGQAIVVGDNVVIRVVEMRGDHVRLGIEAPRSVVVHREEVAEDIRNENRTARESASVDVSRLPRPVGGAKPKRSARPQSSERVDRSDPVGPAADAAPEQPQSAN